MTTASGPDEMANNIIAAGGLWAALSVALQIGVSQLHNPRPVFVGNSATNQIDVSFPFLESRYRITIERIPDSEEPA